MDRSIPVMGGWHVSVDSRPGDLSGCLTQAPGEVPRARPSTPQLGQNGDGASSITALKDGERNPRYEYDYDQRSQDPAYNQGLQDVTYNQGSHNPTYDPGSSYTTNFDSHTPRSFQSQQIGSIAHTPLIPSASTNYSFSPTGGLDHQFGTLNLNTPAFPPPSIGIKTRDPKRSAEKFDPNYKVHNSWQFKWGRVFKMIWSEPPGSNADGSTNHTGSWRQRHGKDVFEKVRRFVIVKADEGHCICLAIFTYNGQGVLKNGVHADHHAVIYTGSEPTPLQGEVEKGLTKQSIKMSYKDPRHKLDKMSRLNYAKLYTIEYNVKVWFVGEISSQWEPHVRWNYDQVHPPLVKPSAAGSLPPSDPNLFAHAQGGFDPHTSDDIVEEEEEPLEGEGNDDLVDYGSQPPYETHPTSIQPEDTHKAD